MRTRNIVIICVALLAAGILFWPTLYRYDKMTSGELSVPMRMNRLTGYTEYFYGGKWNPEKGRKERKPMQVLPADQQARITGNASLSFGSFSGKIYNGSDWTVTGLTFRVVAKEKDGSVRWDRKFKESMNVQPLSTTSFSVSVTGDQGCASHEWSIDEAIGFKDR